MPQVEPEQEGKPRGFGTKQGLRTWRFTGSTANRQSGQTKEEFLQVTIAITNRSEDKPLAFQGWGVEKRPDAKRAVVRDDLGHPYRGHRFPAKP